MSENQRKSNVYCCVPQCSSYYDGTTSFHLFPTYNIKLRDEWIRVLKIGKKVSPCMRVCSKHFNNADFFFKDQVNKRTRLKKNVIPSRNLPVRLHDKTINKKLAKERLERIEKRQRQVKDAVREEEINTPKEEINTPKEEINTPTLGMGRDNEMLDAAATLISLGSIKVKSSPTYEDKAVQVNTYEEEEFNKFDVADVIDTNKKLQILTGLNSLSLLNTLVAVLMAGNKEKVKLDAKKLILLTLMRLKLDLTFAALAVLFRISCASAKKYFNTTICQLSLLLSPVIRFPPKEEIMNNMPLCFKKFKQTRIVLDCTEIEIQKSKCLKCRIRSYSFYKGRHTVKFLIGVAPSGLITYLSKPYGGRVSDKAIFNKENMIRLFEYPDAIMVDKGFLIDKECEENFIKLFRPPFLRKKKQLSKAEAVRNVEIARARVHVERRIQRIKTFRVCRNVIPWSLLPLIEDIMTVVVALTNLAPPILAPDKF